MSYRVSNEIFLSFLSFNRLFLLLVIINFIFSFQLFAGESEKTLGKETGLDIPRFVSIKVDKAYLRRGPSKDHKIDWVYKRRNLPMKIIDEFGHWRKVEDFQGYQGWMYKSLFSGKRFIIVKKEETLLRNKNNFEGLGKALLKKNVIAKMLSCDFLWCLIEVERLRGWVLKADIWGTKSRKFSE